MSVVTISRQMASHGDQIAAEAAQVLGFRFIDREIIHRAAEEVGVPKIALQEIAYEGRRSLVERILQAMNTMPHVPATAEAWRREAAASVAQPFGGIFSAAVPPFAVTLKDYVHVMDMVIRNLSQEGSVVLVGRGGQVVLQAMPQALHIQIVAPFDKRVMTLVQRDGIEESEASAVLKASDLARKDYLQRYYHVNWLDPTLYDLVINTGKVSPSMATGLIVDAYRGVQGQQHE